MDNYKQLYEKANEEYKEFYPLTDILSIIDKESGKNLKQLLNQYNHIKLDWKGNTVDTRNSVPLILRHKGLFVTYDTGSNIVTEYYTGDDISASINTIWQNDNNWTNFSVAAGLADQEDITEVNGKFKFADRNHNAAQFTGMGRVILRKNLVDVGGGTVKNVLTKDMINKSNTIYEIRYDFDLNGEEITVPEGCILDFQGGSLNNGVIVGNNTAIQSSPIKIFDIDIELKDNWNASEAYPEWFGAKGDGINDDRDAFNKTFSVFDVISLSPKKIYNVTAWRDDIVATKRVGILLKSNSVLKGNNATIKTSNNNNLGYNILCCYDVDNVTIQDLYLIGDKGEYENSTVQHGFGLGIHGSSNVYANNIKATNMQGDGFYIGALDTSESKTSSDIILNNCYANSNYRNALSIICGDYITVKNSQFYNHGFYATVDLEPNHNYESIKNVRFENCFIRNTEVEHAAFAQDDTVDTSISQVALHNCEIVGLVRILQKNPASYINLIDCKITDGIVKIDSVGKTLIKNSYIKKHPYHYGVTFNQEFTHDISSTSSGTKIINTTIDCAETVQWLEGTAISFVGGTLDSIYKYYNIELYNIDVINDNNARPIRLFNYAEFDKESIKFNKVKFYGKYTDATIGNPIFISECDIQIKAVKTENFGSYISFYEKYIFTSPSSMTLKKGYIGDGIYTIINNSEGNVIISKGDFDKILHNGVVTSQVIIPSNEIAYLFVDYKNSICNIVKNHNTIEFQETLEASYKFTGHFYYSKENNCICINGNNGMRYFYADNVNRIGNERPINIPEGYQFYDKSLNKPIWWTGSKWVDATGADV